MYEEVWEDNDYPIAYFITFRTFGTWLHGDERSSIDRHGKNIYGQEKIGLDPKFSVLMESNMESDVVLLNGAQRKVVRLAIISVCEFRGYVLKALSVRTNHVHAVVCALTVPDKILNAFKSNVTRELRQAGLVSPEQKIWSRGGSTRYLWKPHNVANAIEYTINGQGDDLPEF